MPPWDRYQADSGPWSKYAPKKQETYEEAVSSPEGKQLAGELRSKADRMLLEHAGGAASNPAYAGLSSAANTAMLNIPRNIAAGLRTLKPGSRSFEQEYSYLRDVDEAAARQSPWASGAGTLAGLVGSVAALPVAPAATLGGRVAQGAAIGGGMSGAAEFADSKDLARTGQAALGGAVLGGLAPPVVEGAARAVGGLGRGVASQVRSVLNAEGEAGRRVAEALRRDAQVGGSRLDEAALSRAQEAGQPAVVADMGGEMTRGLARSAANTSPEAREALRRATDARFESQAPRVAGFIDNLVGGGDALATREALKAQAARINRPAYRKAYAEGDKGIWTPELERIAGSPDVLAAMKSATVTGKSRAINDGYGAFNPGVLITEDGRVIFKSGKQGVPTYPNLQYWDYVKRELDDAGNAAQRAGRSEEASRIKAQSRMLRDELDNVVPSYKGARSGAAAFFGAEDALDAGEKFVTARGKNSEYAKAIAKMSEPERKLFADGFASRLSNQIMETGDRRNVLNSVFNSKAAKERVYMALGPERAKEFEAFMRMEGLMDSLRGAVQGNSTTARQLVEAGLAGGAVGALSADNVSAGAILGALARGGKMKIDARVAKRVGEMLASDDPEIYKRAVRMVSKNSRLMDFIKDAEIRIGGLASGVSDSAGSGIVAASRQVAGHTPAAADNEQENVIPTVRRQ